MSQRHAIITGGSRGLGLAISRELLKKKEWSLSILARTQEDLIKCTKMLNKEFPGAEFATYQCDVTNKVEVDQTLNKINQKHLVDLVINNAGQIIVGPYETMTEKNFRDQMEVHLFAIMNMCNKMIPLFKKQGRGQFINICSMGGQVAVPHMLPYDCSKFALSGYSQGLSAELKQHNITVTTVYPELMMTGSPVKATFKGDAVKEFTWFAFSDYMPFLSLPAEKAAKMIVAAIDTKTYVLTFSFSAKLRSMALALAPNTLISLFSYANSKLPKGKGKSSAQLGHALRSKSSLFQKYFAEKAEKIEAQYNQKQPVRAAVSKNKPTDMYLN